MCHFVGRRSSIIHKDQKRANLRSVSPSDTFPLLQRSRCFPHLGLFTARWWQTFTIKTSVRAIVYFSQKMVHMSASLWNRGRSTFASAILRQTHHQLCSPPSLSFHLPLWFLLSLSLNVRWEEGARIIGHASVGLFDHVTLWRLHTYVPLNKPSNVAPEAEHGSKGSEGPVLCNDGKMEQFCLCWLYLCVCVCVQLSAARELWGLQLGLHFPVVHFLSRPPTTKKKKKLRKPHILYPNAHGLNINT